MEMTDGGNSRARWLKAELHAHCSLDPTDCRICPHSPEELIGRAAELGYRVLAITCHNLDIWTPGLAEYARARGIVLLPGMEVAAEGTPHPGLISAPPRKTSTPWPRSAPVPAKTRSSSPRTPSTRDP